MTTGELEKITINMAPVDLGQIDLLVREGFYQNRTDCIRTAIRNQLSTHAETVERTVARKTLVLGLQLYTRRDLEAVRAAGETLQIRVLGLASIADDIPPELVLATIDSLEVLGAFRASPEGGAGGADPAVIERGEHVHCMTRCSPVWLRPRASRARVGSTRQPPRYSAPSGAGSPLGSRRMSPARRRSQSRGR